MIHSSRDYQLDNIKGIMIFCVIFTHAISNLYKGWSDVFITKYLYYFVYTFHMPVFIFISGYLSKIKTDYDSYVRKAIVNCLIPYLVFNILYGLPSIMSVLNIFGPKWTLWYLLSLFTWKIIVSIFPKIRWSFPLTILLSLYIGLTKSVGSYLSLSRTICFFPFFYAGYLCSNDLIEKVRGFKKIFPCLSFLLTMITAGILSNMNIKTSTLFLNSSYSDLGQTGFQGILLRGILLICGFLCIFFFISVTPKRKTIVSNFGMYSITVYLGHSVVIRGLKYLKIIGISNPFVFILFAIIFALSLCFAFGNENISQLYHRIMNKISALIIL